MEIYRDSNVVIYLLLQDNDYIVKIHKIESGIEKIPLGYLVGRNLLIFPISLKKSITESVVKNEIK